MKATKENINQFHPGMWASICCIEDLHQVDEETYDEYVNEFNEQIEDGENTWLMFWSTKEEAIKDLMTPYVTEYTLTRLNINKQNENP